MAQTGYTPISIYYSATSTNVPTAGSLVAGELALNTADGKLFYKDSSNVVQVIGTKGGVGTSSTTQVLYNSSGLVAGSSNFVFDGTNVGIGTSSPQGKLAISAGGAQGIEFLMSSATAIGVQSYNRNTSAYIDQGYVGSVFSWTTGGVGERMRIDSSGIVRINNTSNATYAAQLNIYSPSTNNCAIHCRTNTSSAISQIIFGNATSNFVGDISTSGSLTSYNVTSDRRLKENITPLTTGLASIIALKPSQYNYKADPTTFIQGFVADELQQVVPHAVSGEANAVDKEGNPIYQGVDASFLIPHLVSAIQELNAKVDAQATTIESMQSKLKDAGILGF